MKLVVTDGATLSGGGVSLDIFSQFGEVQIYDLTAPEQLAERVRDADGILCNKTPIPAELFDRGAVFLPEAAVCGRMCHRL